MINLKFTNDMLTLLKTLKGQCFLSYEKEKNIINDNSTYGNIRINFEKISIDLVNEQELYEEFEEELACFSCIKVDANQKFIPIAVGETEIIQEKGTVNKIEIVTDTINLNHSEVLIESDSAISFYTDYGCYTFARTIWFSEVISILFNKSFDSICPISNVVEAWINDGENDVTVNRKTTEIV